MSLSRSSPRRALGPFRRFLRLFRRRRAPRPSDQEWLRLILLVRKLQHSQYAFVQRIDEMRSLASTLGALRTDLGAVHEGLTAARASAGELERGLAERVTSVHRPDQERAAFEQRMAHLDELSARLETLAAQVPNELPFSAELGTTLTELKELAGRFEAVQRAATAAGGQNELAALYERIQDLAEGLAQAPASEAGTVSALIDTSFAPRLERIESALVTLQAERSVVPGGLARLELLADRLEQGSESTGVAPQGFDGLLRRFEELARRLEETPAGLPELPPGTVSEGADSARLAAELEELRATLGCEQEARRRVDSELESVRGELRKLELARAETETRHVNDLTQLADHAQRQILRVEDDLKKKKRGLSELTQQNIALQNEVNRLKTEVACATAGSPVPSAARAAKGAAPLAKLMAPEPETPGDSPAESKP